MKAENLRFLSFPPFDFAQGKLRRESSRVFCLPALARLRPVRRYDVCAASREEYPRKALEFPSGTGKGERLL
jgi:hypothetical protein